MHRGCGSWKRVNGRRCDPLWVIDDRCQSASQRPLGEPLGTIPPHMAVYAQTACGDWWDHGYMRGVGPLGGYQYQMQHAARPSPSGRRTPSRNSAEPEGPRGSSGLSMPASSFSVVFPSNCCCNHRYHRMNLRPRWGAHHESSGSERFIPVRRVLLIR